MPAHSDPAPPSPFGTHDYRIDCLPPEAPRKVDIGAFGALPLRIGDHYTIDREDRLYDLVVEQVKLSAEGRWTARCRVFAPLWP